MEERFSRVRSAKDIIIPAVLVAAGALLVALPTSVSVNIIGFTFAFAGLILLLILKSAYRDAETGEKFRKKERFFPASRMESITRAISANPQSIDMKDENKGNGLRVDIYYNRNTGNVFIQAFEYIPYSYKPCSPLYRYDMEKAEKLIK